MYFFLVNLAVLDVAYACTVVPKLLEMLVAEKRTISYEGCMTQMYFLSWSVAAEVLLFTAMAYDFFVAICQPLHYSSRLHHLHHPEDPTAKGKHCAFCTCSSHLMVFTTYYSTVISTCLYPGSSYSPEMHKGMDVLYSTLHYGTLMSSRVCVALAAFVWFAGAFNASLLTGLVLRLTFCGPNLIEHFFCEIPPVLLLSCSPTFLNDIMTIIADMFLSGLNFLLTMVSYGCIIASILRIRSAEGKRRAFSTCSSHLIVVTLYYSTVLYTYIRPALGSAGLLDKAVAVLYTIVTPTLNPLIYTLRNKEFKAALKKLFPCSPK
ncbi:olfactory receptor 13A1-like [Orycteropus afer afer]|uniref:Olfactory receptor 13A1-like n=1 Tax=Orycteropus afer afer TaxID=1230840 RepID=A0A8B7BD58_ORYAF|nr:olfactory receptor 13A1-like [Orycteropus afer afer]